MKFSVTRENVTIIFRAYIGKEKRVVIKQFISVLWLLLRRL